MKLSTEKKLIDWKNGLVVAKGEREGVGWTGSLGLMDANYCIWSRYIMRSCCIAFSPLVAVTVSIIAT